MSDEVGELLLLVENSQARKIKDICEQSYGALKRGTEYLLKIC